LLLLLVLVCVGLLCGACGESGSAVCVARSCVLLLVRVVRAATERAEVGGKERSKARTGTEGRWGAREGVVLVAGAGGVCG